MEWLTRVGRLQRKVESDNLEAIVGDTENGRYNFSWRTATYHQVGKYLKERGLKGQEFVLVEDHEKVDADFRPKN